MKNLFYDDFHMRCFFSQFLCSHCIETVLPTYYHDDDDDHFNDDDDDDDNYVMFAKQNAALDDEDDVTAITIVFLVMKLRWWV